MPWLTFGFLPARRPLTCQELFLDDDEARRAVAASAQAVRLSTSATPSTETRLAAALALRYSGLSADCVVADEDKAAYAARNRAYASSMAEIYRDFISSGGGGESTGLSRAVVGGLYAEALMQIRPWKLWEPAGGGAAPVAEGAEGAGATVEDCETAEVVAVLEAELALGLDHPMLDHLYVHLMEMSPEPAKALPCCARLRSKWPDFGHLIHMASHIDMLVRGDEVIGI